MPEPITPHTRKVGLIGWPVGHSGSPRMHNAAFAAAGMDWVYLPLPVPVTPKDRIGEAVRGLEALGFRGANVTIPHKRNVMSHLSDISAVARAAGAVNTLTVRDSGDLAGDNTDVWGFYSVLEEAEWSAHGGSALVLGAGGSARAVLTGLLEAGCRDVRVHNRTRTRAEELVRDFRALYPAASLHVTGSEQEVSAAGREVDLVVNSTSLGMDPHVDTCPVAPDFPWRSGQWAYDLVYNPPATLFLRRAGQGGALCIGGMEMLVRQGARSFEIWTGRMPDLDLMRRELNLHLGFQTDG